MMRISVICYIVAGLILGLICSGSAQTYKIDWYCVSAGGGMASSGGYTLNTTIGQPAAGFVKNKNFLHWAGFWSGEMPNPTVTSSARSAKFYPNGTFLSVVGKVTTSSASHFKDFFYIEESDRSTGIRVACPPDSVAGLAEGSVVNVIGTIGTTSSGEKQMTGPMVIITSSTTPLKPLGMTNSALGGSDLGNPSAGTGQYGVTGGSGLNNIGLLVRIWGTVSEEGGNLYISDGGERVMIDKSLLASPPSPGQFVSITGISSLYGNPDRLRLIMPRSTEDVREY